MKIVLYTDQPVLAFGLKAALADTGVELHMVCSTLEGLRDLIKTQGPATILMDHTPEVNFAVLSELKMIAGDSRIVLWTHDISTEMAFQAMGLGVRGILRKTLPANLVVKCLQQVAAGELWFEKALTDSFITSKRVALTQREGQLIRLVAQGMKNKEIAYQLGITYGTVKVYMSRLFARLKVKDRYELAIYGRNNLGAEPLRSMPTGPMPAPRSLMLA